MIRLEHRIVIDAAMPVVFMHASAVEQHAAFLPGYQESRIVKREGDRLLLQRRAIVRGRMYAWKSWAWFEPNCAVHFEQAEGPLQGMRVEWRCAPLSDSQTQLTITHQLSLRRSWPLRFFLERFFFAPLIHEMAQAVVEAMKINCENRKGEGTV